MNDNVFVALRPYNGDKENGVPIDLHMIFTEEFNSQKPMEATYRTQWLSYNPKRNGTPVPDELKLPSELFLVCKGERKLSFDFFTQNRGEWLVSSEFLNFIKDNNLLDGKYEISKLTVLSTGGKPITKKQYFLVRILQYNNDLIDWEKTPTVDACEKPINYDFYPSICFKENLEIPEMLFIDKIAFKHSFLASERIKSMMENQKFIGFDFYTLSEFIEESQNRRAPFKPPYTAYKSVL